MEERSKTYLWIVAVGVVAIPVIAFFLWEMQHGGFGDTYIIPVQTCVYIWDYPRGVCIPYESILTLKKPEVELINLSTDGCNITIYKQRVEEYKIYIKLVRDCDDTTDAYNHILWFYKPRR